MEHSKTVFYLKINNIQRDNLQIFWHWIEIIHEFDADYFVVCDRPEVQQVLENYCIDRGEKSAINYMNSYRQELSPFCEGILTDKWLNVAYAHLTPLIHAKKCGYRWIWSIDADDTLLCASPFHCAQLLHAAQRCALSYDCDMFSLDMWYSRGHGNQWTFGVAFANVKKDYSAILEKGFQFYCSKFDAKKPMEKILNLDMYFSLLKESGLLQLGTFFCEGLLFEHYGCWVSKYESNRISYIKNNYDEISDVEIAIPAIKLDYVLPTGMSTINIRNAIMEYHDSEIAYDHVPNIALTRTTMLDFDTLCKHRNIVLWGSGGDGRRALSALRVAGIPVDYFCDNNPQLWGSVIDGVKVISPGELMQSNAKVVIASPRFFNEIKMQLDQMGVIVLNAQ